MGTVEEVVASLEKQIDNHVARIERLEKAVADLASQVSAFTTPIGSAPSLSGAEQLVIDVLGGQQVERENVLGEAAKVVEQAVAVSRAAASRMASTVAASPLTRNFRPSEFGYTSDNFKRDYPDVSPVAVLESFFNHHLSKSDVSKNWLEKFWSYAHRAQQIERERRMSNPSDTDSMGLPTDRKARREMLGQ